MKKTLTVAAALSAAAFLLSSSPVLAQVDVVESTPRMPSANSLPGAASNNASSNGVSSNGASSSNVTLQTPPVAQATTGAQNPQAEMFYRLQQLQMEVQQLRGLVEEQAYELKRLKQQRLDDYVDLDRRISAVGGSAGSKAGTASDGANTTEKQTPAGTSQKVGAAAGGELQAYRAAFQSLKQKNYAEAKDRFSAYLNDYPQGRYAANCQYWVAEIYLLEGDLEQARQWFTRLLDANPQHDKAADAKFKLGTVYHKLGDTEQAKALLTEVAASNANAARLAKDYLARNLP